MNNLRSAGHPELPLASPDHLVFIPDDAPLAQACARVQTLVIGAHPDDVELLAASAIAEHHARGDAGLGAVVCADGAGSPRNGPFAGLSDAEMVATRTDEQIAAARRGGYGLLVTLRLPSAQIKTPAGSPLRSDLRAVLAATRPQRVITHNLADRHDTHLAVALAVIDAVRTFPPAEQPAAVCGAEVWRGLDWLPAAARVRLVVDDPHGVAVAALALHASQIAGGKRYDLASVGRRRANATFDESHAVDRAEELTWAMDLTPLCRDPQLDVETFLDAQLASFRGELLAPLRRLRG